MGVGETTEHHFQISARREKSSLSCCLGYPSEAVEDQQRTFSDVLGCAWCISNTNLVTFSLPLQEEYDRG